MAGEAKERLKDRFWLVLHEPGCVPERKGPWLDQKGEMARVLREFMKARPTAYIDVLTLDHDGPTVHHGPEMLQMIDGRSMSRGRRHNAQTRQAHASAHARLAELTRLREERLLRNARGCNGCRLAQRDRRDDRAAS